MGRTVTAGKLTLGEGLPKTIVPVSGEAGLFDGIRAAIQAGADMLEWRCDSVDGLLHKAKALLDGMLPVLGDTPLLFTCRTKGEGGPIELAEEDYLALLKTAAAHPAVTLVDVEVFSHKNAADCLAAVKEAGKVSVASRHDFVKTPEQAEILASLRTMQKMGADIVKIALMPNTPSDVLSLLSALCTFSTADDAAPAIGISMGRLGTVSRAAGGVFGSCATFTCVGEGSAPGQLPLAVLSGLLPLFQ